MWCNDEAFQRDFLGKYEGELPSDNGESNAYNPGHNRKRFCAHGLYS